MLNLLVILMAWLLPVLGIERDDAVLYFAGDAMQHTPQIRSAKQPDGSYDYSPCFRYVSADISGADFAAVNLECPLGGAPYSGYPRFSAPDAFAQALKSAGFNLLQTANNHTLDCRDRGALRTLAVLDSLEIPHIGTYSQATNSRDDQVPYITMVKDYKVAFLSYTYGTNGIAVQGPSLAVNYIDYDKMERDVLRARSLKAEIVCVMIHWGVEYMQTPTAEQRRVADFLLSLGVDIIVGGHPHVVQPMEMRFNVATGRNSLIIYSLGNYISNQNDTNSRGGATAKVVIGISGCRPAVKSATCGLVFVKKPHHPGEPYTLIPANREDLIDNLSRPQFNAFIGNARRVMNRGNIGVIEIY